MGLQNIFPIPIYTTILDKKIISSIENLIVPRLKDLDQNQSQKTDFFKSRIVSQEETLPFFNHISPIISKYSIESNLSTLPKLEYWVQDYSKNEHHHPHAHGNSTISGVYYIRANEYAGALRFTNPNPLFTITNFKNGPKNEINFEVKPQRGLLVLFPGWLLHEAIPSSNKSCIRTCLAFNIIK